MQESLLRFQDSGFINQSSEFKITMHNSGSGFFIQDLCMIQASGFKVQGSGFNIQGSGCSIQDLRMGVSGSRMGMLNLRFRIQDSGIRILDQDSDL